MAGVIQQATQHIESTMTILEHLSIFFSPEGGKYLQKHSKTESLKKTIFEEKNKNFNVRLNQQIKRYMSSVLACVNDPK